jgi:hypothetical protein
MALARARMLVGPEVRADTTVKLASERFTGIRAVYQHVLASPV